MTQRPTPFDKLGMLGGCSLTALVRSPTVLLRALTALVLLALAASLCLAAEDQLIWRIGSCDNNYAEFAIATDYPRYPSRFPNDVAFEIGKSDPAKDWPFIQPGPTDAWAGSRRHSSKIIFDLATRPEETCVLRVDLVDCHASVPPKISLRVNDREQSFDLGGGAGDASVTRPENGREQVISLYVDARDLRQGRNEAAITSIEGSWILYDCVSLAQRAGAMPSVENLSLARTILFKERKGAVRQVVRASMDLFRDQPAIRVVLASEKGWRAEQTFRDIKSGHNDLEVEFPPVDSEQKVRLKLVAGGESREAETTVGPERKWRIYLLPSTHFDIGYTAIQDECLRIHRENADRAMAWSRAYPGFIWNCECSYIAEDYLDRGKAPAEFVAAAERGSMGVQGLFGNELTGICSHEGLIRLVDYYDYLRRKHGIESKCAMMSDVPTMVATVPMILAGHGIKYLSHGINATRARGDQEPYNTPHYWASPDGSRVLMWKTPGYGQCASITGYGDSGSLSSVARSVNGLLAGYAGRNDYPFDAILLHGGYGDNCANGRALAELPDEWNKRYAYPKLIFCRGGEFFEYIEANFAKHLKTYRGDGGVWWEDGAASSARETAITREAKNKLVTAEKMLAFRDPEFQRAVKGDFEEAWKNVLLYDEHTWGAAQSIDAPDSKATLEQWAVKKGFADKAAQLAAGLLDRVTRRFAGSLRVPRGSIVSFNPSSWPRKTRNAGPTVPPLGCSVREAHSLGVPAPLIMDQAYLENRYYRIEFDKATGAVKSIYDRELDRELVDASQYGANQYLYVTGGEGSAVINMGQPAPNLKVDTTSGAELAKMVQPGEQAMQVTCTAPNARRMTVRVELPDNQKRIDFANEIDKEPNLAKEAGYFAFPFAFRNPTIRIEIPNGVIRPETDQFKGACRDWYSVQDFLTVCDNQFAVAFTPVDSPLVTLQDMWRGQWREHLAIENGYVFAYVFNNYWFTNYRASQSGKLVFRFSVTSAKTISDLQAKRFGESVQQPLVEISAPAGRAAKASLPRSLLSVRPESVVVQAVKPARFAEGTIVRLREMSGRACTARVAPNGIPFRRAYLANLAEDKLKPLSVTKGEIEVPCRALGLATVLLER